MGMTVLVDMDGVAADLMGGFRKAWTAAGGVTLPPHEEHREWDLFGMVPAHQKGLVNKIFCTPGFFAGLEPIPGVVEAVAAMSREHHVVFCTTPWDSNPLCMSEKHVWLQEKFGKKAARNAIYASDKTLVRGDVLIDDKPEIKGVMTPVWRHIVYWQPYNQHVTDRTHLRAWTEWRDAL